MSSDSPNIHIDNQGSSTDTNREKSRQKVKAQYRTGTDHDIETNNISIEELFSHQNSSVENFWPAKHGPGGTVVENSNSTAKGNPNPDRRSKQQEFEKKMQDHFIKNQIQFTQENASHYIRSKGIAPKSSDAPKKNMHNKT